MSQNIQQNETEQIGIGRIQTLLNDLPYRTVITSQNIYESYTCIEAKIGQSTVVVYIFSDWAGAIVDDEVAGLSIDEIEDNIEVLVDGDGL
jgi:hypothetical protein